MTKWINEIEDMSSNEAEKFVEIMERKSIPTFSDWAEYNDFVAIDGIYDPEVSEKYDGLYGDEIRSARDEVSE